MKSVTLLLAVALAPAALAADTVPAAFTAEYSLRSMGAKFALMKRRFLRLENGEYLYRSETSPRGLLALIRKDNIVEQSRWAQDETGIKPLLYEYSHTGGRKDRNVVIRFDWAGMRIETSVNGSTWKMQMQRNIMDKLLYQLAIMQDLGAGKNSIRYTIADGGKVKSYDFDRVGEESISTPLGDFTTIKLERHKQSSEQQTTLWCAPALSYLPVKVENIEADGRKTTAIIETLTGISY